MNVEWTVNRRVPLAACLPVLSGRKRALAASCQWHPKRAMMRCSCIRLSLRSRSLPVTGFRLVGLPRLAKQLHQRFHFARIQMTELSMMTIPHLGVQILQQPHAIRCDADEADAAVIRWPLALDQSALSQLVP